MSDHKVRYGDHEIGFSIRYRDGINHKVAIHVQPDARIMIDAPGGTCMRDIKQALLKRAQWVTRQLSLAQKQHRHALPRLYVSGETHWYLGKRYLLKVRIAAKLEADTKLKRGMLLINLPATSAQKPDFPQSSRVQLQLEAWYLQRAGVVFERRLNDLCSNLAWVVQKPVWQLRKMSKQWGSCSPKGRVSLNPLLVKAPRICIDYVILHELCHLKHHNHGKAFYRLLRQECPQWKSVKTRLDHMSEQILID
ncbi:MAG: M48 family metallopeptidase [Gammaproteobacteria bacterium]|nr:M48 family metallopeptidase [Gammaproteobacteria bacterium]